MARAGKRRRPPVTREARPARQPNGEHPRVLAAKLYELHEEGGADQEYLERWPGDGELYGVLAFAEKHADRLRDREAHQEAALLRMMLAEWLRQLADPFQLRAMDDARAAGVSWDRLAIQLGFTDLDGEPRPSSAHNRHSRLKVAAHGTPEDRRQPEVARLIEKREAEVRLARTRFVQAEEARYPAMDAAARALLHHYTRGELLADPDDNFWWGELAAAVDDRQGASERANLLVYVRGAVRETYAFAEQSGQDLAATQEALHALEAAAALVGERPADESA
jgi:hypothetical protein